MRHNFRKTLLLGILFTFSVINSFAQGSAHMDGEIMVRIQPDANIQQVASELTWILGVNAHTEIREEVSPQMDIWLLEFDHTKVNERHFLDFAKAHPNVMEAQFNHILTQRETVPNDPNIDEQWHWINDGQTGGTVDADVDADNAWDLTTGGLTANGDTIVVAVVDDGADFDHPDLDINYWRNWAEIPNNNIDDDGNGYVDDYLGWNNQSNSDNVSGGSHGVNVAGMIGAIGNNDHEGCGINWNVKIMTITGNYANEAGSISAYTYALTQRQIYNQTNGAAGAFVVATNSSWGIDGGDPASAPLWCAFYDTLGVNGILSCGATANNNVDIDVVGDLPTACASEYMIAVTATNHNDVRTFSGYGATTIDLGAPGEDVYTTAGNGGYTTTSGTSFASPLVSGVIALLYSLPCSNISSIAASDPAYAAEQIRDYLFQGVDPIANLATETVYGGRVNAYNSLQLILQNCGPCPPPYNLEVASYTDTDATVTWVPGDSTLTTRLQWREVGMMTWNTVANATSPYDLTGLVACTNYEFQIQAECAAETSDYSDPLAFKTDGCCEPPSTLSAMNLTDTSGELTWNSVLAANSYNLRWREVGSGVWNTVTGATFPHALNTLTACTNYIFEIQTVCMSGTITDWSNAYEFASTCGSCTENNYCAANSEDASFEWIDEVDIDGLVNPSGLNDGYIGFFSTPFELSQYETHNFTFTPGFSGQLYDEWWTVFIDYNQNGTFEPTEEAYDSGSASNNPVTGSFTVPGTAALGFTRMRIMMRWDDPVTGPCSTNYDYGEVEDYCVNISMGVPACEAPVELTANDIAIGASELSWTLNVDAIDYNLRYREMGTAPWTEFLNVGTPPYTMNNLTECLVHEFQIQSVCPTNIGPYSLPKPFNMCISVNDLPEGITAFSATPNPFDEQITVHLNLDSSYDLRFELVNIKGQVLQTMTPANISSGEHAFTLNMDTDYASGIYFLRLTADDGVGVVKLLKK